MNLINLIFRNTLRHPLRTLLTILGMAIAVMAFSVIRSSIDAWYQNARTASPDLLITRNAISLIFDMPISYLDKVRNIDGVRAASHAQWFGGIYVDQSNFFPKFAVESETYFPLYPKYVIAPDQMAAWQAERNAVIVGRKLADRFGWKLGDNITLTGDIFPGQWEFVVRGIYTGRDERTNESTWFFHYDYLNERMRAESPARADYIGSMIIQIEDPTQAAAVSERVDALFVNSMAETKTETEEAFTLGFVSMSGSLISGLQVISIMVLGIVLLVLGNTMAMTARERINEYAVFKTLGFRAYHIVGLILGESVFIAFIGGLAGLGLTLLGMPLLRIALTNFLPSVPLETITLILGFLAAMLVGLLAAIFPTTKALRTTIVDGLRTID